MKKYFSIIVAFFFLPNTSFSQNHAVQFIENEYVTVADNNAFDITGDFTIEVWINPTLFTSRAGIISKYQNPSAFGITLRLSSTGNFKGLCVNEMETADNILQANKWQHITAVKSGATLKMYVDGIEHALTGTAFTVAANSDPLRFGVDFMAGDARYFMGKIDDVRIWNVARTQVQIKSQMFNRSIAANATGLVAQYDFNEGSGTTAGNTCTNTLGIDGTLVSQFIWTTSPIDFAQNCLTLDGVDDQMMVADNANLDITGDFTYEAWIKPASFNWLGGIISKYQNPGTNGNTFRLSATGNFRGVNINDYYTADNLLTANTWHHVAATRSGNTYSIYIDGVSYPLTGNPMTVQANSDPVRIGVDYLDAGSPRYFHGAIDEVRIWNVARTGAQILANMNRELDPATQTGLVAYYTFDEGIPGGTNTQLLTVPDQKNDHNGTVSGFTLTGTLSNFTSSFGTMVTLPLKWHYVQASAKMHRVDLSWKVADCSSCTHFFIEQSSDGIRWESKAQVKVIKGQLAYNWTDFNPTVGRSYYRIISINLNGTREYSTVVSVSPENASEKTIRVNSNPVADQLVFQTTIAAEIILVNSSGNLVWKGFRQPGIHSIQVSDFPSGVYYLRMKQQVITIVKQ